MSEPSWITRLISIFAIETVTNEVVDTFRRQTQLNKAREYSKITGKPLLNLSCGDTEFGDINADIIPQNVKNFVLFTPDRPLPFSDKYFGAVYSSHTLEHSRKPLFLLSELNRISDKVFIVLPNFWSHQAINITHRFIPLDQSGKNWLPNPFFSEFLTLKVEKLNLWSTNKLVQ